MIQVEFKLALPDGLAKEAEAAGLLTPNAIETLLREEVRRRRVDELFEAADRLAGVKLKPMSEAEVEAEIREARMAKR